MRPVTSAPPARCWSPLHPYQRVDLDPGAPAVLAAALERLARVLDGEPVDVAHVGIGLDRHHHAHQAHLHAPVVLLIAVTATPGSGACTRAAAATRPCSAARGRPPSRTRSAAVCGKPLGIKVATTAMFGWARKPALRGNGTRRHASQPGTPDLSPPHLSRHGGPRRRRAMAAASVSLPATAMLAWPGRGGAPRRPPKLARRVVAAPGAGGLLKSTSRMVDGGPCCPNDRANYSRSSPCPPQQRSSR